ncbi:MAG: HAMP domain-containing sensor histidine kinase [Anaerolineales bacterium]|jgi:signal transduction histidine kinase
MFRFLRLRLTLLYLLGALLLVAGVDAAVYLLLQKENQTSIDVALEHRAALALHEVGEPLPPALARGELEWYAGRGGVPTIAAVPTAGENSETEGEGNGETTPAPAVGSAAVWQTGEPEFDAELSPITLAAIRTDGGVDILTGAKNLSVQTESVSAALQNGLDFRTIDGSSGSRIRLLTLRLIGVPGYSALQVGRSLTDQDRTMANLAMVLLEAGVAFAAVLGAVSWWLSGRALRSAQEAWDKQQAFIAHAGHELRTPLTMIRAAAEVTQRKLPAGDGRREPVAEIISETDRMNQLVGDLLLLSRLDAGALPMEREPIDLAPMVEEVARSFGRVAADRKVTVRAGPLPGRAIGSENRLRQVLLIVLDNALRHAPEGSTIEIGSSAAGKKILLTVHDHGEGISPEDLPHVFERFYRGRGEGAEGGSGLGLAIAKELVEAMRGKIQIASDAGRGTTVTVELEAAG